MGRKWPLKDTSADRLFSNRRDPYNLRLPDFAPTSEAGRILALDVGKKRIGLALSDALGISAQGLPTFHRTRIRDDLRQLRELIRLHEVKLIVVGNPLHMSGDESRQSAYTAEFAERLRLASGVPVILWDERLTSKEAERVLREGRATIEEKKRAVDRLAAVLLLESYLGSIASYPGDES
jgi:putative holliday junction resolvase